VCHNIPDYKHFDDVLRALLAKAAAPVAAVAAFAWLVSLITVAMVVGALTVTTAALLIAVTVRVIRNRRAIAVHAPRMQAAEAWALAAARAERRQHQQPLRVASEVPAALEATPPVVPVWATESIKQPHERNSR
jgi:hypothetical protein